MRAAVAAAVAVSPAVAATPSDAAAATPPVDFHVSLDSRARLGGSVAIKMGLKIDHRQVASPVTGVQILTPAGLDITSSGFGLETCRLAQASITNVLVGSAFQTLCPGNSLLGHGTAAAQLQFNTVDAPILGRANISLFSGETQENRPGLIVFVASINPVFTGLAYTGHLFNARRPYGLGMKLLLPLIPSPPFGATVSLARMDITIGARDIVYTERHRGAPVRYRPDSLMLPAKCPRAGFAFRVKLTFHQDPRRTVDTRVPCPSRRKTT